MPLFTTKIIVRAMKLTAIILLSFSLHVSAKLQSQVTLSEKNAPLEKVLASINKQTGFHFIYGEGILEEAGSITVHVKNVSLEDAIKACLKDKNLTYEIQEKVVVIKKKLIVNPPVEKADAMIDITGKVQLDNGEAVAGATVLVKGTDRITTTNASGDFELKQVFDNAILIISGVSIETVEIPVNGRTSVSINVKAKFNELDATVVKGYYNTTKRLNTGNVSTVKGEDIQKQPVSNPIVALEGKVPGLFIQQQSGLPGAFSTVRLRGKNSISNGNDPLFIVDGVQYPSNSLTNPTSAPAGIRASPFNYLSPSDIESIEVLKDADATAIYGSRGANGVILITTRKGKPGKTQTVINLNSGFGKVAKKMKMLNTQQYLLMRHEAFENDNALIGSSNADYDLLAWDTTRYTDWQKVLIGGTAKYSTIQASLSGGNENIHFLVSGTYNTQTTVFPSSFSDKKYSNHLSVEHLSLDKKFRITVSANYIVDNNLLPQADMTTFITLAPNAPQIYDSLGKLNWENLTFPNPLSISKRDYRVTTKNLIANTTISYQLLRNLELKTNVGYNSLNTDEKIKTPLSSFPAEVASITQLRSIKLARNDLNSWTVEPQVSYQFTADLLKLNMLVGGSFQQSIQEGNVISVSNFQSDALLENILAGTTISIDNVNYSKYRYGAIFAALQANYNSKYLVNITARRDGSSRFGAQNQFGNFGAVGLAYIFTKEPFFRNHLPFISFGKIKGSYGTTGNDQLPDYAYLSTYTSTGVSYSGIAGLHPTSIPNPYFGWEEVKKLEAGIELGFLDDRLFTSVSYYRNRTGNQLVGYPLASLTGSTSVIANLPAVVQNQGVEVSITSTNVKSQYFKWETALNFTIPKNKLVSFPDISKSAYANSLEVGKSLNVFKAFHFAGIDPATGLISFSSNNGQTDQPIYPDDLFVYKHLEQEYYGGVENNLTYKGFELDIFFQFVKQTGRNYIPMFRAPGTFGVENSNQPIQVLDRWETQKDVTDIQKFTQDYGSQAAALYDVAINRSDITVSDASFVRLKNIQISYSLPKRLSNRIRTDDISFYVQGQNIVTITNYVGLDPETQGKTLPPLRVITFGCKLNF